MKYITAVLIIFALRQSVLGADSNENSIYTAGLPCSTLKFAVKSPKIIKVDEKLLIIEVNIDNPTDNDVEFHFYETTTQHFRLYSKDGGKVFHRDSVGMCEPIGGRINVLAGKSSVIKFELAFSDTYEVKKGKYTYDLMYDLRLDKEFANRSKSESDTSPWVKWISNIEIEIE